MKDDTPLNDPNSIELELLSNLVADYSEEHFASVSYTHLELSTGLTENLQNFPDG